MNSPFVKNFEQLFQNIQSDIELDGNVSLYIASDKADSMFEKLLVQELVRTINNKQVRFLAVRNIVMKETYKEQKFFTKFVEQLETLQIPLMYHDVVNRSLIPFFQKKGYSLLEEKKYEESLISMYKIF